MEFKLSTLTYEEVLRFLKETDNEFQLPLSAKVDLLSYAKKLSEFSMFSYCVENEMIVGMISCYMNRPPEAYISNVCVRSEFRKRGLFLTMFNNLLNCLKELHFSSIRLEVANDNTIARTVYSKLGFLPSGVASDKSQYLSFTINY